MMSGLGICLKKNELRYNPIFYAETIMTPAKKNESFDFFNSFCVIMVIGGVF